MKKYVRDYVVVDERGKQVKFKRDVTLDCEIKGRNGGKIFRFSDSVLAYYNSEMRLNLKSKAIADYVLDDRSRGEETLFYFHESDLLEVRDFLARHNLDVYRR